MKTYIVTLGGLALHYYGQGVYGWGSRPSIDRGQLGRLVEFTMRDEALAWIKRSTQFGRGAEVQERGKQPPGAAI